MRPQDLYPTVGELVHEAAGAADRIAVISADCELWEADDLRIDAGAPWSADETHAALLSDLAGAEEAYRSAAGRLEGAWAALGRLSSD